MTLTYVTEPTIRQLDEIENLIKLCRLHEPISFSFQGAENTYVLLYHNQILISFASLFFPQDNLCECMGFTHPFYRNQGFFSKCLIQVCEQLDQMEADLGEPMDLALLSDGKSPDGTKTLKALDAEYWYSEYAMVSLTKTLADHSRSAAFSPLPQVSFVESEKNQFAILKGGVTCGSFCLYETDTYACLYDLFIEPQFRCQKLALATLCRLGGDLWQKQIPNLKLQVSELNKEAFSLYRKTGFQITETLSYYLY